MIKVDILKDDLRIKNINYGSIENIYSFYQNTDVFKYATGVYGSISYDTFSNQIAEFISQNNVFFLDIILETKNSSINRNSIGLIKGSLSVKEKILWINSIAIDLPYQSKGYGQKVISILVDHFKNKYNVNTVGLSVSKSNTLGINFWEKCGFSECDFETLYGFHKITEHAVIMWKKM